MARFLNDRQKATGEIPGSLMHLRARRVEKTGMRFIDFTPEKEKLIERFVRKKNVECTSHILGTLGPYFAVMHIDEIFAQN